MQLIALPGIQERFHLVFENAPIGMLIGDTRNRVVHTNKALQAMLGYDADELEKMDIVDLIHHEDLPLSKKIFTDMLSGKREFSQLEERYLHKDGHDVWCKTDVSLLCDKQGYPQMFICMLDDISERKHAGISAHRLVHQYEQILNSTGWGICGLGRNGKIVFVNPQAARMLAWKADELVGQLLNVIARSKDGIEQSSEIERTVDDALNDGLIRHSDGEVFIGRDGASFTVEYTIVPLIEDGFVTGAAILFMDISLRVESERRMQACVKNLMQLNGSLIAAQQRLSSSSLDNMIVDQHLAVGMHVVAEKDDLTALSTNANHFSKRDPGDEWMEMDVHICLDNVLDMIGSEIDSNTQIKKLYGNLPLIQCVPARISQLILSLLMNACQVTNSERIITIRTGIHTNEKENEEEIWIEIADNGKGVPEENNSQIFDPFFIATLAGSGIGMGLPLSYHIIHQHHGRITMESEPGKSSVFNIWLPLLSKRREE